MSANKLINQLSLKRFRRGRQKELSQELPEDKPKMAFPLAPFPPQKELPRELHEKPQKGLLVVGPADLDIVEAQALFEFAELAGWPVIAELASGIRFTAQRRSPSCLVDYPHFVSANATQAETVIKVGGHYLDKTLHQQLDATSSPDSPEASKTRTIIQVSRPGMWEDPHFNASHYFHGNIADFFNGLSHSINPAPAGWLKSWQDADKAAAQVVQETLDESPVSKSPSDKSLLRKALSSGITEAKAVRVLFSHFRQATTQNLLYLSSSLPLRAAEIFAGSGKANLRVLVNRGANGIDGVLSSACGAAIAILGDPKTKDPSRKNPSTDLSQKDSYLKDPVIITVLLGDLALLHDLNALLLPAQLGISLRVIVLNNNGGGIFSHLPIADTMKKADTMKNRQTQQNFSKLFTTPHNMDFSFTSNMPNVSYCRAETLEELNAALLQPAATGSQTITQVIEVPTDIQSYKAQLRNCQKAVQEKVACSYNTGA